MARSTAARFVALLAVVLAVAVSLPGLTSASAAVATPATRNFSSAIEGLPEYQGQTICDPVARPGVNVVKNLLLKTYGNRVVYIPRYGCSGVSEHHEGRALDWMINAEVPAQKAVADSFIKWLLATDKYGNKYAMAKRLGIMYIVHNNRMWRAYDPARGWAGYQNCLTAKNTDDTQCHRNHVHLSFSWDGAMAKTSFYTGKVFNAPTCSTPSVSGSPSPALTNQQFVALPLTRIFDSASGNGVAGGAKCRVSQDMYSGQNRRLDVQVTGRGGVPSTGISGALLSVRATTNAPSTLQVWPSGASKPSTVSVSVGANTTHNATVAVPLGNGGKVSIATKAGSAAVAVDVMGYFRSTNGMLFNPVPNVRVLGQTRVTIPAGSQRIVKAGGFKGVPTTGLGAVALSVSALGTTGGGGLRIGRSAGTQPTGDALGYRTVQWRQVTVVVPTLADGSFVVRNTGTTSAVDVRIDLAGWYGVRGMAYSGNRGTQVASASVGVSGTLTFTATGVGPVPTAARSVALQLSALQPSGPALATARPSGSPPPVALHVAATGVGGSATSHVIVQPGSDRKVAVRLASYAATLRASVVGWWLPTNATGTLTGGGSATVVSRKPFAVSIAATPAKIKLGAGYTVTGRVSPVASGSTVSLQRKVGSSWTTAATTKVSATGSYRFSLRPTAKGSRILRVYKAAGASTSPRGTALAGASASRTVSVI